MSTISSNRFLPKDPFNLTFSIHPICGRTLLLFDHVHVVTHAFCESFSEDMSALCASKNDNYPLYRSHERAAPSRSSTLKIIMNAIELLLADVRNWDLRRQFIISASFICQTVLKYFLCLDAELIAAMILSESQRGVAKEGRKDAKIDSLRTGIVLVNFTIFGAPRPERGGSLFQPLGGWQCWRWTPPKYVN